MLWLLFPLLAVAGVAISLALPAQAAVGYVVVIAWGAILIYLVFYRNEPVAQALERLSKKDGKV